MCVCMYVCMYVSASFVKNDGILFIILILFFQVSLLFFLSLELADKGMVPNLLLAQPQNYLIVLLINKSAIKRHLIIKDNNSTNHKTTFNDKRQQ